MMGGDVAVQGVAELGLGGLEAALAAGRQPVRVGLPGDEGLEDGAAGGAEEVAEQAGELEVGVLEDLLDALGVLGNLADELLAGAGEVAQLGASRTKNTFDLKADAPGRVYRISCGAGPRSGWKLR